MKKENENGVFPKTDFSNYDEFMEMNSELGLRIHEIWDDGNPEDIENFCSFLKENYTDFHRAIQFNTKDEHPWIPEWFLHLCFTICEYDLREKDYDNLRQVIWELGGTVDFDDMRAPNPS